MADSLERKLCADCGSLNLETETRCWACGGQRFAPANTRLAGEPTIAFGSGTDRTTSWTLADAGSQIPRVAYWIGGAAGVAVLMSVLGYWIGRASAPEPRREPPVVLHPIPLPPPSAPPAYADSSLIDTGSTTNAGDSQPPAVSIRPRHSRSADPPASIPPSVIVPPAPGPRPAYSAPVFPPRRPMPSMAVQRARVPPVVNAPPDITPPIPTPAEGKAVISLRNDDDTPVDITIDGERSLTATLAPRAVVPLPVDVGTYSIRVSGRAATSARARLTVSSGRVYSVAVTREQSGDRDTLVLVEPAVDGG